MLINNIHENEYGVEGELYLPLWKKTVNVSISSKEKIPYAEKCADYITNLDNSIVARLARYSYRYFKEFEVNIDDEDLEMPRDTSEEEILNYIYPGVLIIEEECRDEIIEFHMECECAWEIEHGLEFTISDNKILYVGAFDDISPYNQECLDYYGFFVPDDVMNMNYADKE